MANVWKGGALVTVGLALGLGVAGTATAQQSLMLPMRVTENRAPGATGVVELSPAGANMVRVEMRITGLPANQTRAAHIHSRDGAVCDNGAPVTYPLSDVRVDANGVGTSVTTVTLTADKPVRANNAYVNVHEGSTPPGVGVICANVTANLPFTAAAPAAQATPRAQAPAGAPAAPAAPAAPRAQAPAAAPARPAAAPAAPAAAPAAPARLPSTGVSTSADPASGMVSALAAVVALSGAGAIAISRRRRG